MEPITLTAIATTVTTLICSEAAKEIGKEALKDGAKAIGKSAYDKCKQLLTTIRTKFQAEGVEGILTKAETNPTEEKMQNKLRSELEDQMAADPDFAKQLETLIASLKTEPEIEQILLQGIKVKGSATIGDVTQTSDRTSGNVKQTALSDIEVGGDLKIGNAKQSAS
jgi:hypothetical protein